MINGDRRSVRASEAPREATADPRRFIIPERHVSPTLAERLAASAEAVEPRPASTVCLLRERNRGLEALLLRRPGRSSFAADAWVFPGGAVDPGDARPQLLEGSGSRDAAGWAERLGIRDSAEAAGYVLAAVREAWEETGILMADGGGSEAAGRREAARDQLLAGAAPFPEIVQRERWSLRLGDLVYIAHWVTPEPEPRRYDTRFFVARVDPDEECVLRGEELMEACWISPASAGQEFLAGRLRLLPPTVHTLQRISGFATYEELRRELEDAPVPTIRPRMRRVPEGVAIEIEGDDVPA